MEAKQDNVTPLASVETEQQAEKQPASAPSRDLSRAAIVISLLAVVLVAIFFFGLNRNLSGLAAEIQHYESLKGEVQAMNQSIEQIVANMDNITVRLIEMDQKVRTEARQVVRDATLNDMLQKAGYLAGSANVEEADRLREVMRILTEVRQGPAQ